jgi:O-antigen/teichoic acid export membrane protein
MTPATPGASLRGKVVHAGFWSLLLAAAGRLIGFARTVIVARILAPDDIGLFAVASITLLAVDTLSKTGFQSALIHRAGDIDHDLRVAWTSHVVRGFLRGGALFLLAPFVAQFFRTPDAVILIRVIALGMAIEGFANSGVIYLMKELALRKQFLLDMARMLADLGVSVAVALHTRSAIALAFGLVAGYIVQVIMSYWIHPFRPRFTFDRPTLRRLMGYGVWMNLTGIMVLAGTHGASVVVGKVIDVRALGLYQMAHWITQSAIVDVAIAFNVVAFAAYSRMQDDAARMRAAYVRTAGFMAAAALPVAAAIALMGDAFVSTVLGAKWTGSSAALRLLAAAGCFHAIALSGRPIFLGLGQPRSMFLMQSLGAVVLLATIYPLARTAGIAGAATAMIASALATCLFWYPRVRSVLHLRFADLREIFGPALAGTAALVAVIAAALPLAGRREGAAGIAWLAATTLAAAAAYAAALRAVEPIFPSNQPLAAVRALFTKRTSDADES